jgi:hypothetical protein
METNQEPEEINTKNDLKFRESLYRMIISQLFYDGYQQFAVGLSTQLQVEFRKMIIYVKLLMILHNSIFSIQD